MKVDLQVLHSGSSGNCYILTAGTDKLILEAGVNEDELLEALNYDIGSVGAVLCTHR